MPLFNIGALRAGLPRGRRLLGIDPGERRVGLALSDVSLLLASPYAVLPRRKLSLLATEIGAIAAREDVGGLVCGLPLSMDGSFGPAAQAAHDWIGALSERTGLPAATWDERLSSSAVNRMLIEEMDATRARRDAVVDKLAAAYMLQAALDATGQEIGDADGGRDRD
ncbi:MAG: Holliday junction resolvase RuvX [Gluconacetobacter diazotrophicus]|nr:Holliday junction resolvase RuvX [Gluconacetobacter diazotrophicus]